MTVLDTTAAQPRPRRKRRRIIVSALLALFVIGVAVAAWLYRQYTSPAHIRSLVIAQLEEVLGLPVEIAKADFGFFRGTSLENIRVGSSRGAPAGAPATDPPALLTINHVEIEHDSLALLLGSFRVRRAAVESPVVNILPDSRPFARMKFPKARDKDRVLDLPALDIADARINLLKSGEPATLVLSLRGRQATDELYDVVWQRPGDKLETGRLQIDVARGVLRAADGGTPWLSTQTLAPAADFAGPQIGEWIRRLGIQGEFRAREFTIPLTGDESMLTDAPQIRAVVECRNAFASIPIAEEENGILPNRRYLRFDNLTAEIQATQRDIRATASASLHGSPLQLTASLPVGLHDLDRAATAGFEIEISAHDVRFPRRGEGAPEDEARFVELAPRFSIFYDDYNPEGLVDVELSISRPPGENERIALDHAVFHAKDAAVNTKYFPYPIGDVNGVVEFTPTGVYIRDMCGTREGGRACLNGWLGGTKRCSATTLEVVVQDVPIDEELFTGLGPKRAWIREKFNPAGRVDATVINYRPQCDPENPAKWIAEVDVFPQSGSAIYNQLPYPINEITGHIKVLEDEFFVELEGAAAGNAPVTVTGRGELEDRQVTNIDLRITAHGLPIDQQLVGALSPEAGAEVAAFNGQGTIDIDSHVAPGGNDKKATPHTLVSLNGIAIQHDRVPLPLHDLTGQLTIEPGRIHLANVVGRYADARIAASGDVPRVAAADQELIVGIENLTLDGNVHAAVPPALQRALDTWHVGGPIDARIAVTRPNASAGLVFQGDILLNGNTVQPAFLPSQFRDVRGVMHFDSVRVSAKEIEGRYADAPVIANFVIQNAAGASRADVKLLANGLSVGDELLTLLPQDVRDSFRRMGAAGKVDLQIDRLTYTQKSHDHERLWTVQAGVRFIDLALPAIGGLRRVLGTATVNGSLVDAQGGASLGGEIRLQHASLFDRDLTELTTPWTFARTMGGDGYMAMDRITANVYGGELTGRTEVQFAGGRTEFSVTSVIQGVPLASFINAGRRTPDELEVRGTVNANLYLTGEAGHLGSLRGGGQFEIVEGRLYKLPIILAILNVLELTLQPDDAFDEAAAEFYIVGDRVTFRDIVVKGGVLALVGEGVLAIPDLAVDLRLVNVPSSWWARLPLVEDLMKGTVREFVEIRVSGPVTQPSVKTQAIPRITDEIKRLFERRRPKNVVAPGS